MPLRAVRVSTGSEASPWVAWDSRKMLPFHHPVSSWQLLLAEYFPFIAFLNIAFKSK
jgi:hypothetical protein